MSRAKKTPAKPVEGATTGETAAPADEPAPEPTKRRRIQAVTIIKAPGGWTALRYTIEGDRVVKVEHSEPDLKLVAHEQLKRYVAALITAEKGGEL